MGAILIGLCVGVGVGAFNLMLLKLVLWRWEKLYDHPPTDLDG